MKKILISLAILIATQLLNLQQTFAADHFCSSPVNTTAADGTNAALYDCWTTPTIQRVKFYKIAACKTSIGDSTTLTNVNAAKLTAAGCHTIWENAAGENIDVTFGAVLTPTGTVTMPAAGSWPFMYVEIDPAIKLQQNAIQMDATVKVMDGVFNPLDVTSFTSGSFCKTTDSGGRGLTLNYGKSPGNAVCAASINALGGSTGALATHHFNVVNNAEEAADNKGFMHAPGFDIMMIKANQDRFLPGSHCGAGDCEGVVTPTGTKIAGWIQTNSVIDATNNCFSLGFGNRKGTVLTGIIAGAGPGLPSITNFEAGDFDMSVETNCN